MDPDAPLSIVELPLVQEIEEVVAALQRLVRVGAGNITYQNGDVRTLRLNAERIMERMQASSNLWHEDYIAFMRTTLIEISAVGGVLLLVLLCVAFFCFIGTARSLGARATTVLEAFMVIPQPVAQAMKGRSALLLDKVLAEADAAEHADEQQELDGADLDNGDDEEEAERRLIMNESDGESDMGDIGAQRNMGNVVRAASRRLFGQDEGQQARVKIVSVGQAISQTKGKVARNTDPTVGMTRRHLLFSDREITLRPYRNTSSFVQRTVIWLLMPVLLVLMHLLFVVSLQLIQSQVLTHLGERMTAVYLSRRHVSRYVNELMDLSIERNVSKWDIILDRVEHQEAALQAATALVIFGGSESAELIGVDLEVEKLEETDRSTHEGKVRAIFAEDVCIASRYAPITTAGLQLLSATDADAHHAKCMSTAGGVLTEGILSATSAVLSHGRIVSKGAPSSEAAARRRIARFGLLNATTTELIFLLASSPALASEVIEALEVEDPFLRHASSVSAALLADAINDTLQ